MNRAPGALFLCWDKQPNFTLIPDHLTTGLLFTFWILDYFGIKIITVIYFSCNDKDEIWSNIFLNIFKRAIFWETTKNTILSDNIYFSLLNHLDHIFHSANVRIQWGLEYRTRSDFGWSTKFGFRMAFGFRMVQQDGRHFVRTMASLGRFI